MPAVPWIVLPTYNEAENLEAIVAAILPVMREACGRDGFRVLVVDDDSPDGTGRIADAAGRAEHAEVAGAAPPGPRGARARPTWPASPRALAGGAGHVIEMDADFSHDPHDLPRLLARPRADADLVLGSRYVAGGGVADWGAAAAGHQPRRLALRARACSGSTSRDLTGGFKCFRREVLEAIELDSVARTATRSRSS